MNKSLLHRRSFDGVFSDECCDRGFVEELRQLGHDVLYVFESKRGATDDDVLALAFDQRRILLTEDKDFGELRRHRHGPEAVQILLNAFCSAIALARGSRKSLTAATISSNVSGAPTSLAFLMKPRH